MKKTTRSLPKKVKKRFDLAYVQKLQVQERRAATFYEYARHSDPMKDLIMQIRKEGYFSGKPASAELRNLLNQKMRSGGVFKGDLLAMLVVCDGFPNQPFKVTAKYRKVFSPGTQSFGLNPPCFLPWKAVDAHRAGIRKEGKNDLEKLQKDGWYPVVLPWGKYTNGEITEMLGERIASLRPSDTPEPKSGGRDGNYKGLGAVDMIRQLTAYRMHLAGLPRPLGGIPYQSDRGWKNAIEAAEKRIEGMMDHPFFGSS